MFCTLIAVAVEFDLEIKQFDVVGAFFNADRTREKPIACELLNRFKEIGKCVKL